MNTLDGGPPSDIFGGLSPGQARRLYAQAMAAQKARKNLWLVRCESRLQGDISTLMNLYALEVEHGLGEVSGTTARVGTRTVDLPSQAEPGSLRITTLDDKAGTLKRWFEAHIEAIAHADGTCGVPAQYAIQIQTQHAFTTPTAGSYIKRGLYRAQSCETSLSRREDALTELMMSFTQLDSFMR